LIITAANTGDDITIGTMAGTFDAAHLTNITITNLGGAMTVDNVEMLSVDSLSGSATIGELHDATIDTVTTDGALIITAANTGEDDRKSTVEGTFDAAHLTNITITNLGGAMTADNVEMLSIESLSRSSNIDKPDDAKM